jgi:hypothetical protein
MNPFYNLPPTQRETQRFVDEFNADERLWRKLEPRRRARRKILTDLLLWVKLSSAEEFSVSFFLHIKAVFFFFRFHFLSIWLAFSGSAQVSMTWLNLLPVQPRGRTSYRFQDWPQKRTKPIL